MKWNRCFRLFFAIFFLAGNIFERSAFAVEESQPIVVVATIVPLEEFVQEIGDGLVKTQVMIPPGANLHVYEPTPRQLQTVSAAQLYVALGSGLEFENLWLERLQSLNRSMAVCRSGEKVELIESENGAISGNHENHFHGRKDPHIWLSPKNALIIVKAIRDTLVQLDPGHAADYFQRWQNLDRELRKLDQELTKRFSGLKQREFLVYHPAWQYFAHAYGLREVAIEAEGKEPTATRIAGVIRRAREAGIRVIFASPQFNQKSAQVVAEELNGQVVLIDELARPYVQNLRSAADKIFEAGQP